MRKRSKTISFRLSEDLHDKLAAQGSSNGLSIGETARAMIVAQLMGEDVEHRDQIGQVLSSIESLEANQKVTQKRLAYLLFSLLTNVAKLSTDDAKEIVRRDLLKREDA